MSLGPVIVEGRIRYLSVSQLEAYDSEVYGGCARRWHFRYVQGVKEKKRVFQELGSKVHEQIEHYLRTGEDVLGELARAGKRFMPRPGSDLLLEYSFGYLDEPDAVALARKRVSRDELKRANDEGWVWDKEGADTGHILRPGTPAELEALKKPTGPVISPLMAGGLPVIGFVDLLHDRGEWVDDEGTVHAEPGCAEVVDHKTTKQIDDEVDPDTGVVVSKGYAKTAEQLANTWQMTGYAKLALDGWHPQAVRVSHHYFQTQGKRAASKRSKLITADEIRARWRKADALVEQMKATALEPDVRKVEPNYEACEAYKGCPHRAACPRDPKRILAEAFGRKGGASMNKFLSKVKKPEATTPPPPTAPEVDAEMQKLIAEEAAARAGITPPDAPEPKAIAKPPGETVPKGACASGQTVEVDADTAAGRKYACACGETIKISPKKLDDGKWYALVKKHEAKPAKAEPAAELVVEPVAEPAISYGTVEISDADLTPSAVRRLVSEETLASLEPGITLYLDCVEDGVATQRLEAYAEKICADLCDHYKVKDIRFVPKTDRDNPLGFGGWRGALAIVARDCPPAKGAYSVSSGSEIGMVVFEALAPLATRVVRGAR